MNLLLDSGAEFIFDRPLNRVGQNTISRKSPQVHPDGASNFGAPFCVREER